MRYQLTCYEGGIRRAMVETWDCQIIKATPAFLWAIGKHITELMYWCDGNDWRVKLTNEAPYPALMALPTDSDIMQKVSP